MLDAATLTWFLGASVLLLAAPGPAIVYVVAESVDQGRRGGLVAAAGLTAGSLVHTAASVVGLSALLATSAVAFAAFRYTAAAFLVYLGIRQLRERELLRRRPSTAAAPSGTRQAGTPDLAPDDAWRSFRRGIVVNVLNPKSAFLFLLFLPRFVDPARGRVSLQLLVLGLLLVALNLVVDVVYALAAGVVADHLRRHSAGRMSRMARVGGYLPGWVYIGLGVAAVLLPVDGR